MKNLPFLLLLVLGLVGCPDPGPQPDDDDATDDDDDATADDDCAADDDDDSAADDDDDDDATPEPEEVLVPEGADLGVPGQLAGIRAVGSWESVDWVSNQAEVALVAPEPGGPPQLLEPGFHVDTSPVDPAALEFDRVLKAAIKPALEGGAQ